MFRPVKGVAVLASLLALVACTVGQASQQGSAIAPPAPDASFGTAITDKDCQGVGGVTVVPCPIALTEDTKSGIVVTVSGSGCCRLRRRKTQGMLQWKGFATN